MTGRDDDVYLPLHDAGRERRQTVRLGISTPIRDHEVVALHVVQFAQLIEECLPPDAGSRGCGSEREDADLIYALRRLRFCGERRKEETTSERAEKGAAGKH